MHSNRHQKNHHHHQPLHLQLLLEIQEHLHPQVLEQEDLNANALFSSLVPHRHQEIVLVEEVVLVEEEDQVNLDQSSYHQPVLDNFIYDMTKQWSSILCDIFAMLTTICKYPLRHRCQI